MTAFNRDEAERDLALVPDIQILPGDRLTLSSRLAAHLRAALAEIDRLRDELDHVAPASERDHLSRASRRMVDTVMGDRDKLRLEVEAMRPVVEAAERLRTAVGANLDGPLSSDDEEHLFAALDAYRARKP